MSLDRSLTASFRLWGALFHSPKTPTLEVNSFGFQRPALNRQRYIGVNNKFLEEVADLNIVSFCLSCRHPLGALDSFCAVHSGMGQPLPCGTFK